MKRPAAAPGSSQHRTTAGPETRPVRTDAFLSWLDLGRQSLLEGDIPDALWCLRRAIELQSDDPLVWKLVGRCFEEMGEEKRARRCYALAARQIATSGQHVEDEPSALPLLPRMDDPHEG